MAKGLSSAEFKAQIAALAADMRARVEAEVTGLDPSPAAIAERRRRSAPAAAAGFEFFCRTYFPHYVSKPNSKLHDFLYAELPRVVLSDVSENDAIAAPRGEAKSTICSQLFHIYCIAFALKHYTLIIMDVYEQAAMMLEAVKAELEVNPRLATDFPEICGQGTAWREGVIVTRNGIKLQARGAGQRLRGLRHGPHRPDLVTLDDLENDDNSRSPEQRDKLESWIDKAVMALGAAGGKLDVLYVGTILHYDSVLTRKMKNPMWRAMKFQAVIRWPDRMDLWDRWEELVRNLGREIGEQFFAMHRAEMTAGAEVSWVARPIEELMKIRLRVGHAAFDSEYQNDPLNDESAIFKTFTFWVSRRDDWIYGGACDPSLGKQNAKRDPSAILVGGLNRESGKLAIVLASVRRRLPDTIIEDIIEAQREFRCVRWFVEAVQFQEFLVTELLKRSVARRIPVPAVPIKPITDKDLRIQSLQPYVANGFIEFQASQRELLDQLRHYPMADHDDGPDCLAMLWHGMTTMLGTIEFSQLGQMRASTQVGDYVGTRGRGGGRRDLGGYMQ
jgi:predicted phage terminase large subunit-like protein